jgi:hypothetical protein
MKGYFMSINSLSSNRYAPLQQSRLNPKVTQQREGMNFHPDLKQAVDGFYTLAPELMKHVTPHLQTLKESKDSFMLNAELYPSVSDLNGIHELVFTATRSGIPPQFYSRTDHPFMPKTLNEQSVLVRRSFNESDGKGLIQLSIASNDNDATISKKVDELTQRINTTEYRIDPLAYAKAHLPEEQQKGINDELATLFSTEQPTSETIVPS